MLPKDDIEKQLIKIRNLIGQTSKIVSDLHEALTHAEKASRPIDAEIKESIMRISENKNKGV